VNSQNHGGWTPLARASYNNQLAVVITLLKAGAVIGPMDPTNLGDGYSRHFIDRAILIETMIHANQSRLSSLPVDLIRMSVKFLL